jgi:hypothetical protein
VLLYNPDADDKALANPKNLREEPTELLNVLQAVTASIGNIDDAISAMEAQAKKSKVTIGALEELIQYELTRNGRPRVNSEADLQEELRHRHPNRPLGNQDCDGERSRNVDLDEFLQRELVRYGLAPENGGDSRSDGQMSMSSSGLTHSSE